MIKAPRKLARRLAGHVLVASVVARVWAASLAGSGMTFVYYTFVLPAAGAPVLRRERIEFTAFYLLYTLVTGLVVARAIRGLMRPVTAWVSEKRVPSPDEKLATLRLPARVAYLNMAFWTFASVVNAMANLYFGQSLKEMERVFVGTMLAGLSANGLVYFLVEARMRPLFARVLAGSGVVEIRSIGLRARLFLAWLLGSMVPLLSILMIPVFAKRTILTVPIIFVVVVAALVSSAIGVYAARSVSSPVRALYEAVALVGSGDLSASVIVNDAGDVGRLQSGFNSMVDGLKERQHIEDMFGRSVGPEVAQRVLARGLDLRGEAVVASVLFVDIAGSTAMASTLSPSRVVAKLNSFFAVVVQCVEAHSGFVNKFEGDGALAVFGAPESLHDHAAKALKCAATLHKRLVEAGAPDHGIGVSTGVMIEGNIGSAHRFEFTVIGDPVNEASRLSDAAKAQPERVLASQRTVSAARGDGGEWRSVGNLSLRGRDEATLAFCPGSS